MSDGITFKFLKIRVIREEIEKKRVPLSGSETQGVKEAAIFKGFAIEKVGSRCQSCSTLKFIQMVHK